MRRKRASSQKAYQDDIDPSLPGWEEAYYGRHLARHNSTRERIDPHRYFNFP
jgi:hypothetical protein